MDLDRKSGDYRILQRKADSDRQVYQSLLAQQKELRVVANSRANNVQVMERAEVPKFPISPNPRRDWITAILAGLTVAIGLAFGIEYLDDTVKTPDDVTRRFKLPLLGLVPAIRGERVAILTGRRAARLRRGVPIAPHIARLHERRRSYAHHRASRAVSRSKARRRRRRTSRWRWRSAARACC